MSPSDRAAAESYDRKSTSLCRNYLRGTCNRSICKYSHDLSNKELLINSFSFCHDYQNDNCYRRNCKYVHVTAEEQEQFKATGRLPVRLAIEFPTITTPTCAMPSIPYFCNHDDEDAPPKPKVSRYFPQAAPYASFGMYGSPVHPPHFLPPGLVPAQSPVSCHNCETLEKKTMELNLNIESLLKRVSELTQKNNQLSTMNDFLLDQTAALRGYSRPGTTPCVITSTVSMAPVSLATVSMAPVVSLPLGACAPQLVVSSAVGASPAVVALQPAHAQHLGQATTAQLVQGAGQLVNANGQLVQSTGQLLQSNAALLQSVSTQHVVATNAHLVQTDGHLVVSSAQLLPNNARQQLVHPGSNETPIITYPVMSQTILPH